MEKWISGLEERLPKWLAKPQTHEWAQWVYAIWQLLRCNPVILLLLSYLPFMLSQYFRRRKKAVVVLGNTREYYMLNTEMGDYFDHGPFKSNKLQCIARHNFWYTVKYKDYYYITHVNPLADLEKCSQLFGEDIIFVENLVRIGKVAVGKRLSETEAYEKILSKRYYCSKGANLVVPTNFNYIDFCSKFWVVISSLPILLQANNNEKLSNLMSLLIILLDLNRGRLYRLYDRIFNCFAKFVKLKVFKKRSGLYDFFSAFSKRWGYTDTVKKRAYVAQPGDELWICSYSKLQKPNDIEIVRWETYNKDPDDQHVFMEIDIDEAHCDLMQYDITYAWVRLRRPVYVS